MREHEPQAEAALHRGALRADAATAQQSSVCDHHQPTALSLTSTYASTKRLGGSRWYAYLGVRDEEAQDQPPRVV